MERIKKEGQRKEELYFKEKEVMLQQQKEYKSKLEITTLHLQSAEEKINELSSTMNRRQQEHSASKKMLEQQLQRLTVTLNDLEFSKNKELTELRSRLDEAYSLHEKSEMRTTELMKQQDALAEKWKNEHKEAVAHFQR